MNNKMILIKTDKVLSSVESIQRGREALFYSSVSPEKTSETNREGKASLCWISSHSNKERKEENLLQNMEWTSCISSPYSLLGNEERTVDEKKRGRKYWSNWEKKARFALLSRKENRKIKGLKSVFLSYHLDTKTHILSVFLCRRKT